RHRGRARGRRPGDPLSDRAPEGRAGGGGGARPVEHGRLRRREDARPVAMLLSDFSIKRPISTVVIIIALMCLGLLALNKLRVNQIPDVEQPVMVVTVPYPGASPETVEREIINRVEKALQSIPQVYQIRSTASESQAQIVI